LKLPTQEQMRNYCMWGVQNYLDAEKQYADNQKEELCFKLLENFSYEKITTLDSKTHREVYLYKWNQTDCGKFLDTPWSLLEHMQLHEGLRPHRWDWWGKTFSQRGNLKKHVRQHINPDVNDRKRFKCRYWEKGYTERYNLKVGLILLLRFPSSIAPSTLGHKNKLLKLLVVLIDVL
jgi:hypothetical protein